MVLFIALKPTLCSIKSVLAEEIELRVKNVLCVLMHYLVVILV